MEPIVLERAVKNPCLTVWRTASAVDVLSLSRALSQIKAQTLRALNVVAVTVLIVNPVRRDEG